MQYSLSILSRHLSLIWITLIIFIAGFILSALVEKFNIEIIKRLPKWFTKKILRFSDPKKPFWQIMMFIFLFNSISIFVYMMSAVTIILPILVILITGLNIGIIIQEQNDIIDTKNIKDPSPISALAGILVLFIEVFVFCFALAMGLSMAVVLSINYSAAKIIAMAEPRIISYITICVPLLLISAYLETKALKEISK